MTVGERIKKIRNNLVMSQVDFADTINVSNQTLYKYENNIITNIPSDKIEAAAHLGNVSPAYLMGWDDESIEARYNTLSSHNSESLSRYAEYLYLSERQLLTNRDCNKYIDFIIASKVDSLNSTGKKEALKRIAELAKISWYTDTDDTKANTEQTDNVTPDESDNTYQPTTIAAHFDGDKYTDDEIDEIHQFTEFVKNRKKEK